MSKKNIYLPHFLLLITMLLWSSAYVGIKIALYSYSPGAMSLLRYFIASLAMIPLYLRYRTKKQTFSKSEIGRILFLGIIGIGAYSVALNYGETKVSAGTASFIINQAPVLIIILAVFLLKERLGIVGWLGFLLSCVGIFIIAFGEEHQTMHLQSEMIVVILAMVMSALYTITQKPLLMKFDGVELTALIIWGGTALLLIFTPQLANEIKTASLTATLTVIYLGIFPGVIGYTFWSLALAKISATQAGSYIYIMPILTTIIEYFVFKEIPLSLSLAGGLTALIGSIIVQVSKNREKSIIKNNETSLF